MKEEEIEAFRTRMKQSGLDCVDPIVADSKFHKFADFWYLLHPDPPVGFYGWWKRGVKGTWYGSTCWSDQKRYRVWDLERIADQYHEEEIRRREARATANRIYAEARPVESHGCLQAKGVRAHGDLREHKGELVVPLRDMSGNLQTLQFINVAGMSGFMKGGHVAGHFFTLADDGQGALVIGEDYLAAASIHEATGLSAVAAMDNGNLMAVARSMREKWPTREIILATDTTGLEKGAEAAFAIRGRLAVPQFPGLLEKPASFNDLARLSGFAEVKRQVENAVFCGATND